METWQWVFVQDNKDTGGQDSTKTNKQKQSTLSGIMRQWEKKISPLGKKWKQYYSGRMKIKTFMLTLNSENT